MKRLLLGLLLVLLVAGAGGAVYVLFIADADKGTPRMLRELVDEPARATAVSPRGTLAVLGRLMPADGVIEVTATPGDRLLELHVSEGETVERGQILGLLESERLSELDLRQAQAKRDEALARQAAEIQLAESEVRLAKLALDQVEEEPLELAAQQQQIDVLEKSWHLAEQQLARMQDLPDEIMSEQERQQQALVVAKAEAEYKAAQAKLDQLRQELRFRRQTAQSQYEAAQAKLAVAQSALSRKALELAVEAAAQQLGRSQLVAPRSGTVLRLFTREGERIGQQPVLQLADLKRMVCVAEVFETDVQKIELGQSARIASPALGEQPLTGTVTRVSQVVGTPGLRPLDPLAPVDYHIMEVRLALDEPSTARAAYFVHLQVDVEFLPASPAAAAPSSSTGSEPDDPMRAVDGQSDQKTK